MTPWAPPLGVRIVNRPQLGGNRKSAPLKTVALSGQRAVRSTSAARENQRPAKLGPSLRRAPGQNRTLLLLSHKQRANENNSGTPALAPHCSPPLCRETVQVTHSSPGSSLWRKWPRSAREELCMDGLGEGPGLQEGKTEGLKSHGWQQSGSPGCLASSV